MTTTTHSRRIRTATVRLGLGGAAGFWVTNFAISLTPIAAEYRSPASDGAHSDAQRAEPDLARVWAAQITRTPCYRASG
ncbi:MAG: hypothetical protein WBC14_09665 [Propionicimonas sp.]